MVREKRVLALIPARGGSKGIKDKNIYPLQGRPLISYSIDAAKQSRYIDAIVVTTDSETIADVARANGAEVPFLRPPELAADTSKIIDAVLHAVDFLKGEGRTYDILVLLQPTQPLRTAQDIDMALEVYCEGAEQPLCSVHPVVDSPHLIRSVSREGKLVPILKESSTIRRQDMPSFYRVNGAIYVYPVESLSAKTSFNDGTVPFFMETGYSVDIDTMDDLRVAEMVLLEEQGGSGMSKNNYVDKNCRGEV